MEIALEQKGLCGSAFRPRAGAADPLEAGTAITVTASASAATRDLLLAVRGTIAAS
jgi:hypothetical protein